LLKIGGASDFDVIGHGWIREHVYDFSHLVQTP
jgi:hypothetical protein